MNEPLGLYIFGIALAALALAGVSLIETAMVSVSRVRLHQLAEQGNRNAPLVLRLLDSSQEMLAGLVIAINSCVLLIANLVTVLTVSKWGHHALLPANAVMLLCLLLFCEIIPKTISVQFAEGIALRTVRLSLFINGIFSPLIWLLTGISKGILTLFIGVRILPGQLRPTPTAFSDEDIKQLVSAGEESGEVEAAEREMIHGAIEFSETSVYEVMVQRTDVVMLDAESSLEEAIDAFMESGHSRIPVYEDSPDNILGVLYIKDLLVHLAKGAPPTPLAQLAREAYFVPESKKIDDLLREMRQKQVHMAVVVDEYGGTAGIITIEDMLEEIVGEIIDEYDIESHEVTHLPGGNAIVSGRASLDKIGETFDIPMPEDTDAETISGLVTDRLGHIPQVGDSVVVACVRFSVIEVAHNRAERLRAEVLPPECIPPADEA